MGVLNRTSDAVLMIDKAPACAGKLPIKPAHTEQKSPLRELHRTLLTADTQSWALLEASGSPTLPTVLFPPLLQVGEQRTGWYPHHCSATLDPLPQHFSLAPTMHAVQVPLPSRYLSYWSPCRPYALLEFQPVCMFLQFSEHLAGR